MNRVWEAIGLSPTTWTTMSASWSPSTQKQYACALSKWARFISLNNVPPTSPSADQCLCFFQSMFEQGASYGSINATRSFLSAFVKIDNMPAGEHPLITRFLKGVSNLRPSRPRYTQTWDPSGVLLFLKAWGPTDELPLDKLTKRLLLTFLLATGQRLQALHHLKAEDISWGPEECTIVYTTKLKTNDPQKNPLQLHFRKYSDSALCIYSHLLQYLPKTAAARPYVIGTIRAPHTRASPDTSVSVRETLTDAGVDTKAFTAYACRHASMSAASRGNVPTSLIMQSAGWRSTTFSRFYDRPVQPSSETNFIPQILSGQPDDGSI